MFGNNLGTKRPLFGEEPEGQGWNTGLDTSGTDNGSSASEMRKKKRRSRWNTDNDEKTVIPGMPTVIPSDMSEAQQRQYVVQLQIEDITRKLRTGELGIPSVPEQRSPSPEPIYNNEGKRLNTREYRTRKKLEEERHKLIQEAVKLNTDFKPPSDYKPPIVRVNDKVMIPQEEHPDINFVGLLIGPRGNTLKTLEKDTGAKIIIRGKGSVKDGKIGRKDGQPLPGEDEPLHAYVTANNPENVKKAVEKIKDIIKQGIEVPEGQNDLRRQQLRELALLNGTLRENDGLQKLRQIAECQTIVTNTIVCTVCGGTGHIAQDCKQKRPGDTFRMQQMQNPADRAKMDSEYMSLMAELGEGPPPPKSDGHPNNMGQSQQQQSYNRTLLSNPPPNPMAINSPWQMHANRPPMAGPVPPPPNSGPGPAPLLHRPPMGMNTSAPQINPMGRLPMPLMSTPVQPPPGMQGPPGMQQPPPGMQQQQQQQQQQQHAQQQQQQQNPHHHQQQQQPPPPSMRPWQQQTASQPQPMMNMPQGVTSTGSMGIPPPPPSMMSGPPPPPATSQGQQQAPPPWMQQQQQPPQQHGTMGMAQQPPPPPPSTNAAPWQQQQQPPQHQQMAPPPPPVSMAPWQNQHPPPPPQHHPSQQQAPPPTMMGGPIPHPHQQQQQQQHHPASNGGHQFNNYGPPPPPQMNYGGGNQRMGMMMPVPPPPPPPSS